MDPKHGVSADDRQLQASGGEPNIIRAIYGVRREYLQASLDERNQYGTIEDYFTKALGIDAAGQ